MSGIVDVTAPYAWDGLHRLLADSFAPMAGRIDPPSSLSRFGAADIAIFARTNRIFAVENNGCPIACLFCSADPDALYLGKLAVAAPHRARGLARSLIARAERQARQDALPLLRLRTRIELTENHATFKALGFVEVARTAHPGFTRPTSITFERPVPA